MEKLTHDEPLEVEEAAMEAGFTGGDLEHIEQPHEDTTSSEQEQQQDGDYQQQEEQQQVESPEEEQAAEVEPPLTRAELKAIADRAEFLEQQLKAVHDRAFGKMGELNKKIEALRGMRLSPKAKERLAGEFPELAEMLFDNDGEDTATTQPDHDQNATDISHKKQLSVEAIREELSRDFEKKLLTREHRDWEQVVASKEFNDWLASKPLDVQQTFRTTWDSTYVADTLKEYKQSLQAKAEKERQKKEKTKRLENAITPRGSNNRQRPPGYDLDEEEAAMREAFGG